MDYIKDIDKLTDATSTWKPCKHEGYWFEIKILWWKRKYLWCVKCKEAIPEKIVLLYADILHRRNADGYSMTTYPKNQ